MKLRSFSFVVLSALLLTSCASIPGKNRDEQVTNTDQMVEKALQDLYAQHPAAREQIQKCVGYTVMTNKLTKVPLIGVGAGYGMGFRTAHQEKTYLRMRRLDLGAGWGARGVRSIVIFSKEEPFKKFVDGDIDLNIGAEAAAKVGETGAAGGGSSDAVLQDQGYQSYLLTDAGVSATATLAVIRVKPVRLKSK